MDPCGKSRWPNAQLINVKTKLQSLNIVKAFYLLIAEHFSHLYLRAKHGNYSLRKQYYFMLSFLMGISLQDWWERGQCKRTLGNLEINFKITKYQWCAKHLAAGS